MLKWSLIFFIVAIVAAVFGFGGVSEAAADIGIVLFFIALAAFIITLAAGLFAAKKARDAL